MKVSWKGPIETVIDDDGGTRTSHRKDRYYIPQPFLQIQSSQWSIICWDAKLRHQPLYLQSLLILLQNQLLAAGLSLSTGLPPMPCSAVFASRCCKFIWILKVGRWKAHTYWVLHRKSFHTHEEAALIGEISREVLDNRRRHLLWHSQYCASE